MSSHLMISHIILDEKWLKNILKGSIFQVRFKDCTFIYFEIRTEIVKTFVIFSYNYFQKACIQKMFYVN